MTQCFMMMQFGHSAIPVMSTLMRANTTLAPVQCVRITSKRRKQVNKEYLEAKIDLCLNQAEKQLREEDISNAIANLKRANSALSQLFGFEEDDNE